VTNADRREGGPADVIDGTDLFVGLSGARVMAPEALARMNPDAMVFAMANPNPEVTPEEAAPYARIIATGRSDYPNQINNVLCFPGVFRGAFDVRARSITEKMKMAAAHGIAAIVADGELREDYIVPSVFNRDVAPAVAAAVAAEAKAEGAATAEFEIGYASGETTVHPSPEAAPWTCGSWSASPPWPATGTSRAPPRTSSSPSPPSPSRCAGWRPSSASTCCGAPAAAWS
jgi:malate dehydrogenase (oxaloacetate-decarboxylating)